MSSIVHFIKAGGFVMYPLLLLSLTAVVVMLERLLPILDTTTTVSPLLGLLGTIVGMIGTFNAIAAQTQRGNSDAVLSGVGEALYATATGLIIAVICFIAYNYFSARLRTITGATEQAVTTLINKLVELHHQEHAAHDPNRPTGPVKEEQDRRAVQATARA